MDSYDYVELVHNHRVKYFYSFSLEVIVIYNILLYFTMHRNCKIFLNGGDAKLLILWTKEHHLCLMNGILIFRFNYILYRNSNAFYTAVFNNFTSYKITMFY